MPPLAALRACAAPVARHAHARLCRQLVRTPPARAGRLRAAAPVRRARLQVACGSLLDTPKEVMGAVQRADKLFKAFDTDGSGELSEKEVLTLLNSQQYRAAFQAMGIEVRELARKLCHSIAHLWLIPRPLAYEAEIRGFPVIGLRCTRRYFHHRDPVWRYWVPTEQA